MALLMLFSDVCWTIFNTHSCKLINWKFVCSFVSDLGKNLLPEVDKEMFEGLTSLEVL